MKLSGAHVLVTGASRGIGAVIADGAAHRGATVTLVACSSAGVDQAAGMLEVTAAQLRSVYELNLVAPAELAVDRLVRLQLTRVVPPQDVAGRVVDAIEAGRQPVVPPLRMAPALAFTWLPRRVGDLVLSGVPRR